MTIPVQSAINSYTANGGTTVFPYSFKILLSSDITVAVNDVVQTSGFSISGVGVESGGNITFSTAPTSGSIINIYRDMPYDRTVDYQTNGDLLSSTLNDDIDRVVMQIQQLSENAGSGGRAILAPVGEDGGTIDRAVWDNRASKYLGFNATGAITTLAATAGTGTVATYELVSNYASLNAAIAALGGTSCTLLLDMPTTYSGSTPVPSTMALLGSPGGVITVGTGVTLTINGPFSCGLFQCFSGAGSVVFGSGAVSEVYPEWWGAKADGLDASIATNNTALQSAWSAFPVLSLATGTYKFNATISTTLGNPSIVGKGRDLSFLQYTGSGTAITAGFHEPGGYYYFEAFQLIGTPVAPRLFTGGTTGISGDSGINCEGKNFSIQKFETLLTGAGGFYWKFHGCHFMYTQYGITGVNANNISFFGCKFGYGQNFVTVNGGYGPVSFYGGSIEAWTGAAVSVSYGTDSSVILDGVYVENYPDTAWAGNGIGQFVNGYLIAGPWSSITMLGCTIQCYGVDRVIYSYTATSVNVISKGNTFMLEPVGLSSTSYLYLIPSTSTIDAYDRVIYVARGAISQSKTTASGVPNDTLHCNGYDPITTKPFQTGWTAITPNTAGKWANTNTVGYPVLGCKIENDILYLRGQITVTSATGISSTIGTLPAAITAKLAATTYYGVGVMIASDGTTRSIRMETAAGTIIVLGGAYTNGTIFDIPCISFPLNL